MAADRSRANSLEWRFRQLGGGVECISGSAFKSEFFGDSGMPLIRNRDLRLAAETETRYSGPFDRRYIVKAGDILVGMDGDFRVVTWRGPDAVLNQRVCRIAPRDESLLDRRFLFHSVQKPLALEQNKTTGTTVAHLSAARIRALAIPDLQIGDQRAVAAVLDSIDDAIERAEVVIAATERLRKALLHDLLTRGVPGWHSEWKHVPGLGNVPACWEVETLGEATVELRYGTSTRLSATSGGHAVLRIPNVARGILDTSDLKYADLPQREADALALRPGDLLIVRTNGNPNICGQSVVFDGLEGRWAFASYLLRLRTDHSVLDPVYLWTYLRSAAGRRQLRANIRTSAGNYNLSAAGLSTMRIALPLIEEQARIVEVVRSNADALALDRNELALLYSLKSSIADALLTGRVRVPMAIEAAT